MVSSSRGASIASSTTASAAASAAAGGFGGHGVDRVLECRESGVGFGDGGHDCGGGAQLVCGEHVVSELENVLVSLSIELFVR